MVGLRPNGRRDLSLKSDYTLKLTGKTTTLETITKSSPPFPDAVNFFVCIFFYNQYSWWSEKQVMLYDKSYIKIYADMLTFYVW